MLSIGKVVSCWKMSQLQLPLRRLASQWNCSSLPDRSVLQVTGVEASTFLQGLMTNDINTLVEDERKSLYCMFLNTGGRILFDAIISKGVQPDQFLLDVDTKVSNLAKKHLSLYKVRRKILIKIEANLAVHAVFKDDLNPVVAPDNLTTTQSPVIGSTFCDGGSGVEDTGPPLSQHCLTHPDPRLANLGHRIILDSSDSPSQFLSSDCQLAQLEDFISHRCKLGVAEGADDIPLGKCTPLEYNLDYLHGVSFHKGCYLGQELTARTHHTGVIRKRILPLKLEGKLVQGEEELTVKNQAGKSVGKISETDSLTKDVCSLCQNKLEFCRQYFEQIYNAHVKLLGILREEEPSEISFEEQILHFVRSYSDGSEKKNGHGQTREVVKCEPEIEIAEAKPRKEIKRDSKHFLDDLLDEYDNSMEAVDLKTTNSTTESGAGPIVKKKVGGLKKKKKMKCLVPPPLKKCAECNLKSQTHKENLDHWASCHPDVSVYYKCDWDGCSHTSTQVLEVKRHRRKHLIEDKQLVKCKECEKYYPPKYLQTRHVLVHQEGKNFKCDVCEKGFKTVENLKVHIRTHGPDELKYTHCCELCGRRFTQKANLEAHMRTHTGQRPFGCDFCSKSFSQKGNLDEHRRTHTGEKPYVCDICGSRHTRKGELLLHIRCIHTHERPFQCAFCPKNFQRRDLLRKHERIHTDTRPYGCEFCGKTFTARDKMIVHRRLHTGERPYVCDTCGRGFCESGNLKKHMRVHGTDIPAVVKQNNKGKPAGELNRNVVQEAGGSKKKDHVVAKQEPVVIAEEDGGQQYQSPDSVKTELDETGGSVVYRRVSSMPGEIPEASGGYMVGVPGQQYPQIVQHPLFHQIQSNWTAMYSQMNPHPPPPQ